MKNIGLTGEPGDIVPTCRESKNDDAPTCIAPSNISRTSIEADSTTHTRSKSNVTCMSNFSHNLTDVSNAPDCPPITKKHSSNQLSDEAIEEKFNKLSINVGHEVSSEHEIQSTGYSRLASQHSKPVSTKSRSGALGHDANGPLVGGKNETTNEGVPSDPKMLALLEEEAEEIARNTELLSLRRDFDRKLKAEKAEISRLKDEIQEVQTIYGYRMHSYDSSDADSSSSDTEDDLKTLATDNTDLQRRNADLVQRIQQERDAIVMLKGKLRRGL